MIIIEYESEQTNELAAALAKAQAEMPIIQQDMDNSYFKSKYSSFTQIVKESRPFLAKFGLSVHHGTRIDDGKEILVTTLRHASGQFARSASYIKPKDDKTQTYGADLTYKKRYGYTSIVGLTTGEDDDDDGESDRKAKDTQQYPKKNNIEPLKLSQADTEEKEINDNAKITKEQLEELCYELAGWPVIAKDILAKMSLDSFADLKKSKFLAIMKRIREVKAAELSIRKPTV